MFIAIGVPLNPVTRSLYMLVSAFLKLMVIPIVK